MKPHSWPLASVSVRKSREKPADSLAIGGMPAGLDSPLHFAGAPDKESPRIALFEQSDEARLLEMLVSRERFLDVLVFHEHKKRVREDGAHGFLGSPPT
jgi:hypothetical protein